MIGTLGLSYPQLHDHTYLSSPNPIFLFFEGSEAGDDISFHCIDAFAQVRTPLVPLIFPLLMYHRHLQVRLHFDPDTFRQL